MRLICTYKEQEYQFDIPFNPEDITFSQFLDFRAADQQYLNADGDNVFEKMMECVATVATGDWDKLPYYIEGDEEIKRGYTIQIGEELSISRVYLHLCTIISESDNITDNPGGEITYKGDKYTINTYLDGACSVGEFIETLELERTLTPAIQKGDADGILQFQLGLRQMAILLRKKDEKLPYRKSERDQWITARAKHFEDLPLSIVQHVRHFFFHSMIDFMQRGLTKYSLRESPGEGRESSSGTVKTSGQRSDGTQSIPMQSK